MPGAGCRYDGLDAQIHDRAGCSLADRFGNGGLVEHRQCGKVAAICLKSFFRPFRDTRHHRDSFDWVLADSRFAGKHDCVCSVKYGVRDVARFCPCRTRIPLHGVQHLRGGDDLFSCQIAFPDQVFLYDWNVASVDFHTQIAARHHQAAAHLEYLFGILDAFLVFDFGDDLRVRRIHFFKDFDNFQDIIRSSDKACSDEVHSLLNTEADIRSIFFRQPRHTELGFRHIDTF